MSLKTPTIVVSCRVDQTRVEQIDELRGKERRTRTRMVQVLLEERLDEILEERRRLLRDAHAQELVKE